MPLLGKQGAALGTQIFQPDGSEAGVGAALANEPAAAGKGRLAAVVYNVPLLVAEEDNGVIFVAHVKSPIGRGR